MIGRRAVLALASVAAMAAAAGVAVVAAAYALFAWLHTLMPPAAAAALVSAVAALLLLLGGLLAKGKAKPKHAPEHHHASRGHKLLGFLGGATQAAAPGAASRAADFVRERPVLAIAGAAALAVLAIRNPLLVATVARTFLEPPPPPRR